MSSRRQERWLDRLHDERPELDAAGRAAGRAGVLEGEAGPTAVVDGDRILNFASEDLLGLGSSEPVRTAARQAVIDLGTGAGVVEGADVVPRSHVELEEALASFLEAERVALAGSERDALAAVAGSLGGPGATVLLDAGSRPAFAAAWVASGARVQRFGHRDADAAARTLEEGSHGASRRILATEGLFGLHGDVAPLRDLVAVAEATDALLVLDESCAVGVLGESGKGTPSLHGVDPAGCVRVGSLGRSIGASGGWMAGSADFVRTLAMSAAEGEPMPVLPSVFAAASASALERIVDDPALVERLWRNTHRFHSGLDERGFDRRSSDTPVTTLSTDAATGDPGRGRRRARELLAAGLLTRPVGPPAVAPDDVSLRLTVTAAHDEEDIEGALQILTRVLGG